MPAGVVLRCNAGAVAWQARVAPCSRVGSRPARRPCAVRAAEDKGYFSEAEPEKGLQPLWGQQTKRDLVKEVRSSGVVALCGAPAWAADCNTPRASVLARRKRKAS